MCTLIPRWPVSFSCFNGCFILFFSCDEKKQKARHARKNSRKHSLLISTSSIRSNARLPLDTSSGSRGAAELAPHGYLKKYIPALRSNILAQWPLTRSVSHSIFNGAGFRRCCLYAANSGTEQLAVHVYRATLLPNAQTSSVLFPRLPLTTTHAHTVPFLGDYFCCGFP